MQRQEMADAREVQERQKRAQNRLAEAQEQANTIAAEAVKTDVRLAQQQDETRQRLAEAQEKANVLADLARQVQGRMKQFQLDANGLQKRTNSWLSRSSARRGQPWRHFGRSWATLYAARRDYSEGNNDEKHRRTIARLKGIDDEIARLEQELASGD